MNRAATQQARRALDSRLGALGDAARYAPPQRGWVRAIRNALGMSAADLGRRMGITGPAVSAIERSERAGVVRIETLRRAAEAMDCTLVYAFVPNQGLEGTVQARARQAARRQLRLVATTMALEDQAITVDESLVQRHADRLMTNGRVWSEEP